MTAATDYLQAHKDYFWCYEDQGKVIAVPGGRTLGYSDRIISEIVFHLTDRGMPRFGSLLLAIAATTTHGKEVLEDIMEIVDTRGARSQEVEKGMWFAKLLTTVPTKMKKGNLRVLLLQAVFQDSHNGLGKKKAEQILRELTAVPSVEKYAAAWRERELSPTDYVRSIREDFRTLALIGRELPDVRSIMQRIARLPSLTNALEDLEPEVEPQPQADTLVDRLLDNHETFPIGALVPNLISGLQLSFHASLPSEQPLGGVADITNKGSFDKLLISEYAFEDHVLLSRLANNEALYKHREVPPTDNDYPRVLLIDTTLKNWGTIRTIAFAAAIAIQEHPKNRQATRVFLVGRSYAAVDLDSVIKVLEAQLYLDPTLDPAPGIARLFAEEDLAGSEVFFLGAADSAARPGMQRLAAAAGVRIDHWIHPDAHGGVRVYKHPKRGKRLVQELRLPLEELWRPRGRRRKAAAQVSVYEGDYPLLFPEMRAKAVWRDDRHTYAVSRNKGLYRQYGGPTDTYRGWEFVGGGVPPNGDLKAVITHDDLSATALFRSNAKEFSLISSPGGDRIILPLDRKLHSVKAFSVRDNMFVASVPGGTLCVHVTGDMSTVAPPLAAPLPVNPPRLYGRSSFGNLSQVGITRDGLLRIRKHDLLVTPHRIHFQYRSGAPIPVITSATQVGAERKFVFPDGSEIFHHRDGMLRLRSANQALPDVFLPVQLDTPLGLATPDTFAGSAYFRQEPRIEVLTDQAIGNAEQLAVLISEHLQSVNLNAAGKMAKAGLIVCRDEEELRRLESSLAGFSYRIRRRGLDQETVPIEVFYADYVQPFIDHILNHGTNA